MMFEVYTVLRRTTYLKRNLLKLDIVSVQPGLCRKFQNIQVYIERLCPKQRKRKIRKGKILFVSTEYYFLVKYSKCWGERVSSFSDLEHEKLTRLGLSRSALEKYLIHILFYFIFWAGSHWVSLADLGLI